MKGFQLLQLKEKYCPELEVKWYLLILFHQGDQGDTSSGTWSQECKLIESLNTRVSVKGSEEHSIILQVKENEAQKVTVTMPKFMEV